MNYEEQILSLLLDRYESSPACRRGQVPEKRRMLRLYDGGANEFPAYNIENADAREEINAAVISLAQRGFVGYEWMRGETNHLLAKLWLNYSNLDDEYRFLERTPEADAIDALLCHLIEFRAEIKANWAHNWLNDTIDAIRKKRTVGNSLPADVNEREDLLKVIAALSARSELETPVRVFSVRCFGDSKRFERVVKARLIRILKKYLMEDPDCSDEDTLRRVGLVQSPELFEFAGPLMLTFPGGVLDFGLLPLGGTLTAADLEAASLSVGAEVRRVLSIENHANFVEYVRRSRAKEELVLWHGGQLSPARLLFFQAVSAALSSGCSFYHWGDIDFGGFSMLARLRREVSPKILPLHMNVTELVQYVKFAQAFDKPYAERLKLLCEKPELADCQPTLRFMLEGNLRLEQEALLLPY